MCETIVYIDIRYINKAHLMTVLSKVKKGSRVKIITFAQNLPTKSTIIGIGLLPGDEVSLVSESFLGSPITIRLNDGETVAMRVKEASLINVQILG